MAWRLRHLMMYGSISAAKRVFPCARPSNSGCSAWTAKGLTVGIDDHVIDGVPVKITNTARTIVDCFKRRNEVRLDVAIEALRDARRQRKVDLNEVWRIAERRRALTYMRPYLEALG